ncbi:MAG: hypothetical protein V3V33_15620 [Candidatus Lokiarchaeia archaeon]
MEKRNYFYIAFICLAIIYLSISISLVDRYAVAFFWEFPIEYLIGTFIIIILVKYGLIYGFLSSYDLKGDLFLSVILVNLVSVPLSQLIFIYFPAFLPEYIPTFYFFLFYFFLILIEIIVIVSDWLLYRIEFKKFEQLELINQPISSKKVLKISIVTNILSLLTLFMILYIQSSWATNLMRYG